MRKKSTGKRGSIGKPAEGEKDQLNSHSPSQENDIRAKKSFFEKFGMDRVSYSIAAVLIFFVRHLFWRTISSCRSGGIIFYKIQ